MKALFNRFNRGLGKDRDKDKEKEKEKDRERDKHSSSASSASPALSNKEKLPELPPLREWQQPPQRVATTPSSFNSYKPLPDISSRPLPPIDQSPILISQTNSLASTDSSRSPHSPPSVIQPQFQLQLNPAPALALDERAALGIGSITLTESVPQSSTDPPPVPSTTRSARKPTDASTATAVTSPTVSDSQNQKKVAFISPPPTPAPLTRALAELDSAPSSNEPAATAPQKVTTAPIKTTVTRFQATHGAEARGSPSAASSSKVNVGAKGVNGNANKATSTRTAVTPRPFADNASVNVSVRSGTPYSQASQSTSRILATTSWSEATEEDLVSNLGPRERTRQEVLWEIVTSEERYVAELLKLKETFIEPLLHPYASPPVSSPTPTLDHNDHYYARVESPRESLDHLPIASRFLSPTPSIRPETPATVTGQAPSVGPPNIDGESLETDDDEANDQMGRAYVHNGHVNGIRKTGSSAIAAAAAKFSHPRSPYNTTGVRSGAANNTNNNGNHGNERGPLPFPTRSHNSLPPPARMAPQASTASLGRQSIVGLPIEREREVSYAPTMATDRRTERSAATSSSKVLRKLKRNASSMMDSTLTDALAPHQLPEDLRICLEVLEDGIYNGHVALSEGLRKRYEEQYPLVRSLADVFVSNSHILREYATYVLHLERALEQVDDALSTASDAKKPKNQDAVLWIKICKTLQNLEENAVEKAETGLAISLSKPFQRLLKYPLLFQNLLYHTDPSTFEYESTLQMVAEVENIVRSIEDEKIQKEERDKTRDTFARIEGIEKVRQLAAPKPSRILVEERPVAKASSPISPTGPASKMPLSAAQVANRNVKGKSSFRRISDVLQSAGSSGVGGKKDLWIVKFNDVELRCQRTGITTLPLVSSTNSRTNSLPELQAKAKYATTGRRGNHTKPRNLYKFIKIENWVIAEAAEPRQGAVSMEDVVRSRADIHSGVPTLPIGRTSLLPEDDEDDGNNSSDSDRKSKMSFSYWGADKVTIHKPVMIKSGRTTPAAGAGRKTLTPIGYGRDSSANAKFGTRLVNQDGPHHHRPASRRTQATPTSRRGACSEDGHSAATRATVTSTRPAWDNSTRPVITTPIVTTKRMRNTSQTSGVAPKASSKSLSSPAPSEDSGVGLYRQLMAQDSSLKII